MIKAIDLVCMMEVDTETAEWKSEHNGTTYYFCDSDCKASFDKDPEKYLSGDHEGGHGHR